MLLVLSVDLHWTSVSPLLVESLQHILAVCQDERTCPEAGSRIRPSTLFSVLRGVRAEDGKSQSALIGTVIADGDGPAPCGAELHDEDSEGEAVDEEGGHDLEVNVVDTIDVALTSDSISDALLSKELRQQWSSKRQLDSPGDRTGNKVVAGGYGFDLPASASLVIV